MFITRLIRSVFHVDFFPIAGRLPRRLSGLRVLPKPLPGRFIHESDRVSVVHGHGPRRFCSRCDMCVCERERERVRESKRSVVSFAGGKKIKLIFVRVPTYLQSACCSNTPAKSVWRGENCHHSRKVNSWTKRRFRGLYFCSYFLPRDRIRP